MPWFRGRRGAVRPGVGDHGAIYETADEAVFARLESSVPLAHAIMEARDEAGAIEQSLAPLVYGAPGAPTTTDTGALTRARVAFDAGVARLLELPSATDAAVALRPRLESDRAELDAAVDGVADRLARGDRDGARALAIGAAQPSVDRIRADFAAIVQANTAASASLARQLQEARASFVRVTYSLDAIAFVAAVLVAIAIGVMLRRFLNLEATHARVLEERAAELEAFAGRLAHDVLSPLATVSVVLGAARRKAGPEDWELLLRGERSVGRVQELVDALLAFARSAAPPDADCACPVAKIVSEVVEEARARAPAFAIELTPVPLPDCDVRCAPGVLSSVLSNLVDNALKYTAGREEQEVHVRVLDEHDAVRIEIEDTGPGLAPGEERVVFLPGVRGASASNKPGIGLGLATVKRLVEAHGGSIELQSRAGRGLLVAFTLPRAARTTADAREMQKALGGL